MRFTLVSLPVALRTTILSFSLLAPFVLADVEFTSPNAGGFVPAGTIDVQWQDSGISPPISELTQFTLSLMVGGNEDANMLALTTFESQGTFADGNTARGTIPAGIASEIDGGFFFRIVSTKEQGGTVTNYSPRFSITGLTGNTPLQYRQAAQDLSGSTEGPPAVGNDPSSSSSIYSSATSASTSQTSATASQTLEQTDAGVMTATVTPTSDATSSASATSIPLEPTGGLSTGAIAGIIAACAILGLALVGGLAAWCITRRKQASTVGEVAEIAPQNPFLDDKAELPAASELKPHRAWTNFTELSAESVVHEADSGERPPELDPMAFRAELEGSTPVTPRSGF